MTIAEMREWSNRALSSVPKDVLVALVVLLASSAAFGLGVLADRQMHGTAEEGGGAGFWIENAAASTTVRLPAAAEAAVTSAPKIPVVPAGSMVTPAEGKYVASKSGTKYYLPTCSGAKRIKEANRVWFAAKEEAEASGRTPAANCDGL
jgi:hypothetical protein